ncbi:AraC family transcriptional regulator [Cocleimonas flava]|uniref:AraC family transcriptional regulator n=1 Tax=Cocleimonas flava TaxID=634765 RepID=A0A4R1F297_9GAMM|nr:AraC family transcriptional regulator [Cocleimonas flava]TCJ87540.1 AraC family transcriptional regulator [Cocleimonas flava]
MNSKLETIAIIINEYSKDEGLNHTAIQGVHCFKMSQENNKLPVIYRPSIYVVAQGIKKVMLRDEVFQYSKGNFLAVSVDLPIIGEVIEATIDNPYLCVQIDIDAKKISELAIKLKLCKSSSTVAHTGLFVGDTNDNLLDAIARLLKLLENPKNIPHLAPLVMEEFYYYLLTSPHGSQIIDASMVTNNVQRISKVIDTIKSDLSKTILVDDLAAIANMSPSSFHNQFKKVTTLSPIQYVKRLRLTQARQIMLSDNMDANTTARIVGYESASHFSRDYSKLFGAPPKRDIAKLKLNEDQLHFL